MPAFFDSIKEKMTYKNACIVYNGLTSLFVFHDWWNNPKADRSEYTPFACRRILIKSATGVEPATPASRRQCSTRLSYTPSC